MINYKDYNLKTLGELIILAIILLLGLAIIIHIVAPILHLILPSIFGATMSLSEGLLLLILLRLFMCSK